MSIQSTTVFGIYPAYPNVERGVTVLRTAGFPDSDISVLYPESPDSKESAQKKSDKVQDGATLGGGTGALVGGALGSLVGLAALAIPGIGPFIAAGPILGALAGAGFGGVLGEVAGALLGMGVPEDEAKLYEARVKSGGLLISVHSDGPERTQQARDILQQTGAQDISSTTDAKPSARNEEPPAREVA